MTARRVIIHRIDYHMMRMGDPNRPDAAWYDAVQRTGQLGRFLGQDVIRWEQSNCGQFIDVMVKAPPPTIGEMYNDMTQDYLGVVGRELWVDGEGYPTQPPTHCRHIPEPDPTPRVIGIDHSSGPDTTVITSVSNAVASADQAAASAAAASAVAASNPFLGVVNIANAGDVFGGHVSSEGGNMQSIPRDPPKPARRATPPVHPVRRKRAPD